MYIRGLCKILQRLQMKKDKRTNNDLQSIIKDRVTRTPLITRGELVCSGSMSSSCSISGTLRVILVTTPVTTHKCWHETVVKYTMTNLKPILWQFKSLPFLIFIDKTNEEY